MRRWIPCSIGSREPVDRVSGESSDSGREGRVSDSAAHSPRTDLLSGGALFVFALIYGLGARGLSASGDPGVALVPIGLAVALALLSAGIALSGWRKARQAHVSAASDSSSPAAASLSPPTPAAGSARQPDRDADAESAASEHARDLIRRPAPTRAWTVIGLTILYAALFQTLGYMLATLLYTAAVAERFGAGRRMILVLAPGATLLIFLLFRVILGARLPAGILG